MIKANWKKDFILMWSGQAFSLLTSAIVQYALIWYLTAETKSALVLSMATLLGFLPMALLSPFIGSFVDRFNRKAIMIIADGCIALTVLVLAWIGMGGELPLPAIMIALFIRALGGAFHQPCAQAVTPLIVPAENLAKCNGYIYSFQSISLILSPALAAALFAALPLSLILMLDVAGAAVGMLTVAAVHIPRLKREEQKPFHVVRDALDALKVLRKERGLYLLTFISCLFCIAYIPASSLYPLMCMDYFGGTSVHAGIAEMAFAVGMLVGGLILGVWGGTRNKMITMMAAMVVMGVSLGAMGLLPPEGFWAFAVLTLIAGLSSPFFSSLYMTLLQEKIRPEYLGRIMGVSSSIMAISAPIGLVLSGAFAEKMGLSNWFLMSGIMTFVCIGLSLLSRPVREVDKGGSVLLKKEIDSCSEE